MAHLGLGHLTEKGAAWGQGHLMAEAGGPVFGDARTEGLDRDRWLLLTSDAHCIARFGNPASPVPAESTAADVLWTVYPYLQAFVSSKGNPGLQVRDGRNSQG